MRARLGICLIVLAVSAALPGCRRGPISPDGGALVDGGDLSDAGGPIVDSGPDPVVDSGPPPVIDSGPPPVVDAGPDVIDAGGNNPPPTVDAGPAGAPVRIGFTNDPILMQAGECSGSYPEVPRLRVAVLDGPGNEVTVTEDVSVTLSSTSGTLRFYTDTTCMQNVGQVIIRAGSSGTTLTLRDSEAGEPTIYGSSTAYERGEHTVTVNP